MSTRKSNECVVAVFSDRADAQRAVNDLRDAGHPAADISLVSRSAEEEIRDEQEDAVSHGDETQSRAAKGAGFGGVVGLLAGSALLAIPGVGPVLIAGPLAIGMTGALVGAFLGAMGGWGVHKDHVAQYEEKVKAGKTLVVAHGDPLQVAAADKALRSSAADEVHLHAETDADAADIGGD